MKPRRAGLGPVALVAILAGFTPLPSMAGIKCWTNHEGVRECGNTIPPEFAQKAHREVSEQGVTLGTTERAQSKEELRREREERARLAAIEAEKKRLRAERATKDRVLLSTFTTEKDLKLAHDGQIAAIDIRIQHTEQIVKQLERSLEKHHADAAKLERSGKAMTPELKTKIANMERQIKESTALNERRRQQQAELAAQFEEDLNRYRELKGISKN